jgi:hypothetical protein
MTIATAMTGINSFFFNLTTGCVQWMAYTPMEAKMNNFKYFA